MISLRLEGKTVTQSKVKRIARFFLISNVHLGLELPDSFRVLSRCIVEVRETRFVLPQSLSLLAHWTKHTQQNLLVDFLIDCRAQWLEFTVDDASHIEKRYQHDFDFDFGCLCFHQPRRDGNIHWLLERMVSWFSQTSTSHYEHGSIWRHSMMSWYSFMQRPYWLSFSIFGMILKQTFQMRKYSVILF